MKKKQIEVVAAIIEKDGKLFCAQRPNKGEVGLKWEFPGGKVEPGESNEDALVREIEEELKSKISVDKYFMTIQYEYQTFHLTMHTYLCTLLSGSLELTEHVDSRWVSRVEINRLDWAPADWPIVELLKNKGL